jgi:hypothetical protein
MPRLGFALVVVVLILHGLVHLIGTAVYLKLTDIQDFSYKTTLLGALTWGMAEFAPLGCCGFCPHSGLHSQRSHCCKSWIGGEQRCGR